MRTRAIFALLTTATTAAAIAQLRASTVYWNEEDAVAIRTLLADGFETSWNAHRPETSATPDKCADDAVFLNTTGGWVKGCQPWADMIARLHAPGGLFAEHTRRHEVEELRFVRPDVALAVVRTFDIRRAGLPTKGEETRGVIVLSQEDGHWKVVTNANVRIQENPAGNR